MLQQPFMEERAEELSTGYLSPRLGFLCSSYPRATNKEFNLTVGDPALKQSEN